MANAKRKAFPSNEKALHHRAVKTITSDDISESGKKHPAKMPKSGLKEEEEEKSVDKSIFVPITKVNEEKRIVTGVVLQPEVTDAQGDIYSEEVIEKAAHGFMAKYNKATKLGLMHKYFGKHKFELFESWTAPHDVVINNVTVKKGSWIMTVWVGDDKIWKMVKEAKIKGFSIGGKAKVKKLTSEDV